MIASLPYENRRPLGLYKRGENWILITKEVNN